MRPYMIKYLPVEDEPEEFIRPNASGLSNTEFPSSPQQNPNYPTSQQFIPQGATKPIYPKTPPVMSPLKSPVQSKQSVYEEKLKSRVNSVSTAASSEEFTYYLPHASQTLGGGGGGLWNTVLTPFRLCQTPLVDKGEIEYRQKQGRPVDYYNNNNNPIALTSGSIVTRQSKEEETIYNDEVKYESGPQTSSAGNKEKDDGGGGDSSSRSPNVIPLSEACVNLLNNSWAREKEWFFLKATSDCGDDE